MIECHSPFLFWAKHFLIWKTWQCHTFSDSTQIKTVEFRLWNLPSAIIYKWHTHSDVSVLIMALHGLIFNPFKNSATLWLKYLTYVTLCGNLSTSMPLLYPHYYYYKTYVPCNFTCFAHVGQCVGKLQHLKLPISNDTSSTTQTGGGRGGGPMSMPLLSSIKVSLNVPSAIICFSCFLCCFSH